MTDLVVVKNSSKVILCFYFVYTSGEEEEGLHGVHIRRGPYNKTMQEGICAPAGPDAMPCCCPVLRAYADVTTGALM
jgi:hypothetical protein